MTEPVKSKPVELTEAEARQATGGQNTAIGYGVIGAEIAVAIITGVSAVGKNLTNTFNSITTKLK